MPMSTVLVVLLSITISSCFDPVEISPLPYATNGIAAGSYNGTIYLLGQNYNFVTFDGQSFTTQTPLTFQVDRGSVHIGHRLIMLDIMSNGEYLNVYNMQNNVFTTNWTMTPQPFGNYPSDYCCLAATHDWLYLVGGRAPYSTGAGRVQTLSLNTMQWMYNVPNMRYNRTRHSCIIDPVTLNLYVIAGVRSSTYYTHIEWINTVSLDQWNMISLSRSLTYSAPIILQGDIYIFGGYYYTGYPYYLDTIYVIDPAVNAAVEYPQVLPYAVSDLAVTTLDGIGYGFGGLMKGSPYRTNRCFKFDYTSPTRHPTNPTNSPTQDTNQPTIDPTSYPSLDPTIQPTLEPTFDPTFNPTISPTHSVCIPDSRKPSDVIFLVDNSCGLTVDECETRQRGISELLTAIKYYNQPRFSYLQFSDIVNELVALNDSSYNDLEIGGAMAATQNFINLYDMIRMNDCGGSGKTETALIEAINVAVNKFVQHDPEIERDHKMVIFSNCKYEGYEGNEDELCEMAHTLKRTNILIFNFMPNPSDYLRCLTENDMNRYYEINDVNMLLSDNLLVDSFKMEICQKSATDSPTSYAIIEPTLQTNAPSHAPSSNPAAEITGTAINSELVNTSSSDSSQIVAISLLIGLVVLIPTTITFFACCYHRNKRRRGSDYPRYLTIFKFFGNMADLYTDIWWSLILMNQAHELALYAIIFTVGSHALSIMVGCGFVIKWRQSHSDAAGAIAGYAKRYDTFLIFLIVIAGFYPSADLITSHLFHLNVFSMQLTTKQRAEIRNIKMLNTMLLENIPILIVQYLYLSGSVDVSNMNITLITMAFSITSIVFNMVALMEKLCNKMIVTLDKNKVDDVGAFTIMLKYEMKQIEHGVIGTHHIHSHYLLARACSIALKLSMYRIYTHYILNVSDGIEVHSKLTNLNHIDAAGIMQGLEDSTSEMYHNFKKECCRYLKVNEDKIDLNVLEISRKQPHEMLDENLCCRLSSKRYRQTNVEMMQTVGSDTEIDYVETEKTFIEIQGENEQNQKLNIN